MRRLTALIILLLFAVAFIGQLYSERCCIDLSSIRHVETRDGKTKIVTSSGDEYIIEEGK